MKRSTEPPERGGIRRPGRGISRGDKGGRAKPGTFPLMFVDPARATFPPCDGGTCEPPFSPVAPSKDRE